MASLRHITVNFVDLTRPILANTSLGVILLEVLDQRQSHRFLEVAFTIFFKTFLLHIYIHIDTSGY